MKILIGNTGFVGSNLWENGMFDKGFHSTNIEDAYGLCPDLLVYAGLRAEKYLANQHPEKDLEMIRDAQENIEKIAPKKLVLISTVDVYKNPNELDEDAVIVTEELHPYGHHRYLLEVWVREKYTDALIIRLPALFGINLKKNFIYDFIHIIPFMLKAEKLEELTKREPVLERFYEDKHNGFCQCKELTDMEKQELKKIFHSLNFTAMNFTDSRSQFQFYPLKRLWSDIEIALRKEVKLWNPATEPVLASEVYQYLTGKAFENITTGNPLKYNLFTKYAKAFGGEGHYIMNKAQVLMELKEFVDEQNIAERKN